MNNIKLTPYIPDRSLKKLRLRTNEIRPQFYDLKNGASVTWWITGPKSAPNKTVQVIKNKKGDSFSIVSFFKDGKKLNIYSISESHKLEINPKYSKDFETLDNSHTVLKHEQDLNGKTIFLEGSGKVKGFNTVDRWSVDNNAISYLKDSFLNAIKAQFLTGGKGFFKF